MKMLLYIFICMIGSFILLPLSWADPLPLTSGSIFLPLKQTDVQIKKEDLFIDLTYWSMEVQADFVLENTGAETNFKVAFPCSPKKSEIAGMTCDQRLDIQIEGRDSIDPDIISVVGYGECWVWDMRFSKNEKVILKLWYKTPIQNDRYSIPVAGIFFLHYRLQTGSNWKGPIGELNIQLQTPLENIIQVTPRYNRREPGLIEWHLNNWEPDEDLYVVFDPMLSGRYINLVEAYPGKNEFKSLANDFRKSDTVKQHQQQLQYQRQILKDMGWLGRFPYFPGKGGMQRIVEDSSRMIAMADPPASFSLMHVPENENCKQSCIRKMTVKGRFTDPEKWDQIDLYCGSADYVANNKSNERSIKKFVPCQNEDRLICNLCSLDIYYKSKPIVTKPAFEFDAYEHVSFLDVLRDRETGLDQLVFSCHIGGTMNSRQLVYLFFSPEKNHFKLMGVDPDNFINGLDNSYKKIMQRQKQTGK